MNTNPHDTIFNKQIQCIVFPTNHPDENLCGKPKGMKIISQDHGKTTITRKHH